MFTSARYIPFFERSETADKEVVYKRKKYYVQWNNDSRWASISNDREEIQEFTGDEFDALIIYLGGEGKKHPRDVKKTRKQLALKDGDEHRIMQYYFEVW